MYNPDKISIRGIMASASKTFPALFLITFLITQQLLAQVNDDFTDGDFTTNPMWNGSTGNFIVNSSWQLQLNTTVAGSSYLSTGLPALIENYEWEFYVKQSFAPSGGNFSRFYLMSDQSDLSAPLNGYYLQLGEAGSLDAAELFRQSGSTSISVCRATNGRIAAAFEIRMKVTRNNSGLWQLFIDYSGGNNFVPEASGIDLTHTASTHTGVFCTYTVTNAARFYYDDIRVRPLVVEDLTPPEILSVTILSAIEVNLLFSEALNVTTAENNANYALAGTSHPVSSTLLTDNKTVRLVFSPPFENGSNNTFTIDHVEDLSANIMVRKEIDVRYFMPMPVNFRDVIISEIFPDPSPQVSLPASEFVEVYNRSDNPIDLNNWQFSDGFSTGILPSYILLPGSYLILSPANSSSEFVAYGQGVGLANFPTLNNSSDRLKLSDGNGLVIDSVNYSSAWYKDEDKQAGGWTLELIDPENICSAKQNWTASESETGGSPGKQNSVHANNPDTMGPKLLSVNALNSKDLLLTFDEKLNHLVPSRESFSIDPILGIDQVSFADESQHALMISVSDEIRPSTQYKLRVEDVFDCPGNVMDAGFSQGTFILSEPGVPGDIIVNEILFNPRPTGVDFVEIYNRSGKTINLRDWKVAHVNQGMIENAKVISRKDLFIHPDEYRVFSENGNLLKGEYSMGKEACFFDMDLPAFNDDSGSVALINEMDSSINVFHYSDKMHAVFLHEHEGVSLERISLDGQQDGAENWRSASSMVGFATPGYANSNLRSDGLPGDGSVIVEPEIFQPFVVNQDFAQIKFNFDRGGFVANVKIIDQQGRAVKQLAHNALLGTEGFFRWDGDLDNGSRARTGYYLVWFEVFDSDGTLKIYKKRVVVY